MLRKYFFPDVMYNSVSDINVGALKKQGIDFVILDIDNTLVPYTSPVPDEKALSFLNSLTQNEIKFCFVSNNKLKRVELFNKQIGTYAISNGAKPLLTGIKRAMRAMGAKKENTALIGDQVFTDVCGGKRAGLYTILVNPIQECESRFFRFKRHYEKKIIKKYNSCRGRVNND